MTLRSLAIVHSLRRFAWHSVRRSSRRPARGRRIVSLVTIAAMLASVSAPARAARSTRGDSGDSMVRLPGHVLPALAQARAHPPSAEAAAAPIVVTFVLRRTDAAGFTRYVRALYDPDSPHYRRFSTPAELAERFGPTPAAYDDLLAFLRARGFELIDGSDDRLTLTARGTRAAAERAFAVTIGDYEIGGRRFYANDRDPALPRDLAAHVQAIAGLSNLARPEAATVEQALNICTAVTTVFGAIPITMLAAYFVGLICTAGQIAGDPSNECAYCGFLLPPLAAICAGVCIGADPPFPNPFAGGASGSGPHNPPPGGGPAPLLGRAAGTAQPSSAEAAPLASGAGQTIGITSFSGFDLDDVRDWLALMGVAPERISRLSRVSMNGGAPIGPDAVEPLLDVAAVMSIAPDADVVVYDTPFAGAGSFQTLLNAMIDDGVDVISNSWAYCENQTTRADVESIDAILQTAAAAGISVLSASGDTGSTCLNGSPSTAPVPASAPHITAVGGTSFTFGPGFTYGSETWWDGTAATPPTGRGGFGVSRFFARPGYQDALSGQPMRSLPDVAVNADPAVGHILCQASAGGCPDGKLHGGTSVAAPIWAAFTALLNEAEGENLGFLNPLIYPLAGTDAFHDASSMGSDFAHVGLGSPNLDVLHRFLNGIDVGVPDAATSEGRYAGSILGGAHGYPLSSIPADGASAGLIVVTLRDAAGHTVSGKMVTLAPDGGTATITPPGAVTTDANGQAVFAVTDLQPELVTFTATDTSDGVVLDDEPALLFGVPPAAAAGITATPPSVAADGVAFSTITVTLRDVLDRPTPGKLVRLSQGAGHSVIQAPSPSVTDVNGEIAFTATDTVPRS